MYENEGDQKWTFYKENTTQSIYKAISFKLWEIALGVRTRTSCRFKNWTLSDPLWLKLNIHVSVVKQSKKGFE